MSLATALKDFTDIANEIYNARGVSGNLPNGIVAQHAFIYGLKSLGMGLFYLVSFQWLRDLSYLPLLTPELNPSILVTDLLNPVFFSGANLVEGPFSHLFYFFHSQNPVNDQFIAGFFNSLFFSLPFSLPHLISIRRLFYQGTIATAASIAGTLVAHSLFLIGVMYGIRFFIIPWFSLEPLSYIIGIATLYISIKEIVREKHIKVVRLSDTSTLTRFFIFNFVLAWCEETTIFHSIGNLTVNAAPTYLDIYPARGCLDFFFIQTSYIVAFIFGSIFFSTLFYYFILRGSEILRSWAGITFPKMARTVNKLMIFLIVTFGLSSFPYYGLDYIFGNLLGFLPEDEAYQQTAFSPTVIQSKHRLFKETPSLPNERTPLTLDLNYFDRGSYLNAPFDEDFVENKDPRKSAIPNLSFEELNYQGEYAWILREDASRRLIEAKKSPVSSLFAKTRKYYVKLRAAYDDKREEADKKRHYIGKLPKQDEGILSLHSQAKHKDNRKNLLTLPDFLGQGFLLPKNVEQEMRHFETPGSYAESSLDESDNEGKPRKMIKDVPKYKNVDPLQQDVNLDYEYIEDYSKGFAPPISVTYQESAKNWIPLKRIIKRKFYLNPIYRSLLNLDIDSFLSRQKNTYKLASNQEHSLYQKRQMLAKYYNWLRHYQPFQKTVQLLYEIPESRSFVDRIYHQQFKGTLKVARRLFSVTFDPQENVDNKRILTYDQPLYKDSNFSQNPFIHEELADDNENDNENDNQELQKLRGESSELKNIGVDTDESELEIKNKYHLEFNNKQKGIYPKNSPFIEETYSSPSYAGWDENLRKFIVTNRFITNKSVYNK